MPSLDLWTQPQAGTARSEVEDWPRHVGIPPLVLADRVAVAQPEDLGDVVSVDEVVDDNSPRHASSLRPVADVSYTRHLSVRPRM
jgi:hypothetical protein